MYLLEQPRVDGPGECEPVEDVNSLGLTLLHRRWENIIVPQDSNRVTSVLDTEEALISGRQGGTSGSSSSTSTFEVSGGSSEFGEGTRREHSVHRSSTTGGYSSRSNYSRSSYSSHSEGSSSSLPESQVSIELTPLPPWSHTFFHVSLLSLLGLSRTIATQIPIAINGILTRR
jgi:hypothetical protein